ncbi:hypothetical protein DTL42_02710 [Bremerella cremea]|uniref:Uncharacterized protein n=2 Tax=Bremerella cremea TaxID=1031537 RepID=A0A368KUH5_9BACT|nr:hypothetical protein DTL42_02710 [Bremerella cremea]
MRFENEPTLRTAFEALTPGRKRGYLLDFGGAKQAKSCEARIEKSLPRILAGVGLHDCTCGLSQKMPGCVGSHKELGLFLSKPAAQKETVRPMITRTVSVVSDND